MRPGLALALARIHHTYTNTPAWTHNDRQALDERNKSQRAEKKGRISLEILQALAEQTEREAEEERERAALAKKEKKAREQAMRKKRKFSDDEEDGDSDSQAHAFKLVVSKRPPMVPAKEVPAEALAVAQTAMFGGSRVKRVERFGLGAPRVNKPAKSFVRR